MLVLRSHPKTLKFSLIILGLGIAQHFGNDALRLLESSAPSQSIGTPQDGHLIHGKRLPSSGPGFRTYSRFGSLIGRTAVNNKVRDAILEAYAITYRQRPQTTFVYGETGWPWGGRFRPHHTHRNGMSVDFMVPVLRNGKPSIIPTPPWLKFGYNVSFDEQGRSNSLEIDFDAMVNHLMALEQAASAHGLAIDVVIFAPNLQDDLAKGDADSLLLFSKFRFSRKPSWVRHDDHYHVDFREIFP